MPSTGISMAMNSIFSDFVAQAVASDFFAGGLALGTLGVALGLVRLLSFTLWAQAERRFVTSVTVDNRSSSYRSLFVWLSHHGALARVRQLSATGVQYQGKEIFAPAQGKYWFLHNGRLCTFSRSLRERAQVSNGQGGRPMEVLTVSMLFGRAEVLQAWVDCGAALLEKSNKQQPQLHILRADWWEHICALPKRPMETVLAEDDRLDKLLADLRRFYGAETWYRSRGVPWRRGYLLHGPPGTGKSSVIRALASELGRDVASIALSDRALTDDGLRFALTGAPEGSFLVLEDIDAAFVARRADDISSGISFSGLLNAIDGVAAQEGRALVMTTNHRDRLDPALIRPGRADVHVELGLVGAGVGRALFLRFFPGEERLATEFAQALGSSRLAPAALQGWLLRHAEDPGMAAKAAGLSQSQDLMAAE